MSIFISTIPFNFGNKIRYFFYKKTLKYLGENVLFSFGVILSDKDISIGNNVRFGTYCTIGLADFGDNILVAQSVHFLSGRFQHGTANNGVPMVNQPGRKMRIRVANDIWIGAQSIIMNNISTGCIIGAGSVVVKSIDTPYSVHIGNPATLVKLRN
jgi:acetyltransferase-like isoleucine patch superfamily enzyme